jgi:hypothetical protein
MENDKLGAKLRGLTVRERVLAALYQIRPKDAWRAVDELRQVVHAEENRDALTLAETTALGRVSEAFDDIGRAAYIVAKNATTDEVETAVGRAKPPGLRVVQVFAATPRDAGGMVAGRTEYFTRREEAAAYSPCVATVQMATIDGVTGYVVGNTALIRAHDSVRAVLRERALAKLSPAEREALGLLADDPPKPAAPEARDRSRWAALWHERARAYRSAVKVAREAEADSATERDLTRQVADQAARDRDAAVASALRHRDEDQAAVLAAQDKARKLREERDEARYWLSRAVEMVKSWPNGGAWLHAWRDDVVKHLEGVPAVRILVGETVDRLTKERNEARQERDALRVAMEDLSKCVGGSHVQKVAQERDEARRAADALREEVASLRAMLTPQYGGTPPHKHLWWDSREGMWYGDKDSDAADTWWLPQPPPPPIESGPDRRQVEAARCAHGRVSGSCLVMGCNHHPSMGKPG